VFQARVDADPVLKQKYGNLLHDLERLYENFEPYSLARDYQGEALGRIELFTIAGQLNSLIAAQNNNGVAGFQQNLPRVKERLHNIYKDYHPEVDKHLFAALIEMYVTNQPGELIAPELLAWVELAGGDYQK